jgi:hypothetical protein
MTILADPDDRGLGLAGQGAAQANLEEAPADAAGDLAAPTVTKVRLLRMASAGVQVLEATDRDVAPTAADSMALYAVLIPR